MTGSRGEHAFRTGGSRPRTTAHWCSERALQVTHFAEPQQAFVDGIPRGILYLRRCKRKASKIHPLAGGLPIRYCSRVAHNAFGWQLWIHSAGGLENKFCFSMTQPALHNPPPSVIAIATPFPLLRPLDESSLHEISMDIRQALDELLVLRLVAVIIMCGTRVLETILTAWRASSVILANPQLPTKGNCRPPE